MKEEKLTQNDASKFLPNDLRRLLFSRKVFFVLNKDKVSRRSDYKLFVVVVQYSVGYNPFGEREFMFT